MLACLRKTVRLCTVTTDVYIYLYISNTSLFSLKNQQALRVPGQTYLLQWCFRCFL